MLNIGGLVNSINEIVDNRTRHQQEMNSIQSKLNVMVTTCIYLDVYSCTFLYLNIFLSFNVQPFDS